MYKRQGYDSIGIALELYNVIDLAENDHIDISDKNGQYVPQDESNLIYQMCIRDSFAVHLLS